MIFYTFWLNWMHPGKLLPRDRNRYLDPDGKTERTGPGWIDKRFKWETFADPFDLIGTLKGCPSHEKFWLEPQKWPEVCEDHPRSSTLEVIQESNTTNVGVSNTKQN